MATFGFIGTGNMGGALARAARKRLSGGEILLANRTAAKAEELAEELGCQAADNAGRYAILRRLGAEEKLVSRSAVEQVALAFLLPLGLALVHTVVGMKAANDLIAQAAKVDSVQSALVTALVLLLVYGGYFLATSLACRRLALDR